MQALQVPQFLSGEVDQVLLLLDYRVKSKVYEKIIQRK